ncbi:MAG: hypothetical protein QOD75_1618 [Blastocatellia bacterium]|jgi:hypothetical protein|nr:hypothetical protein [Blastocatellia bacterium]
MIWIIGIALLFIWFVEKFILHKGGFTHMLLLFAIAILVIQWVAKRRAMAS